MIKLIINNNNRVELEGNIKILTKVYKAFKMKHPNAFFLRRSNSMGKGWDGHVDYINKNLHFKPGLLEQVVAKIQEYDEAKIVDNRRDFQVNPKIPKRIGEHMPRDYQRKAIKAILDNRVCGIPHYVGVLNMSTNAGKTTIMAGIHLAFKSKIPTIVLLKDGDLFEQFKRELPSLIPKEQLGFVRGKEMNFNNFTVAMVQTLAPKVKDYSNKLAKFGICLVDEADEGESKTYKTIMSNLYNCKVRVGLSGSIYMSKLKKDAMKNQNLKSFFGEVKFEITKKEMAELGYSTPVIVRLWPGSKEPGIKGFPDEYRQNITLNKDRTNKTVELAKRAIRLGRTPILVIFHFQEHGEKLEKAFRKKIPNKKIGMVHGDIKNRKKIIDDFREGKLDILIGSFILKRGKNFPLIKSIINASATDSQETVSQIMGRGERTHESKKKYYLDDFMDEGRYLKRHSNHRKVYYTKEGFKVINKTG